MYKGGGGRDTFHIKHDYEGRNLGYKVILKDYEDRDKIILGKDFGIIDIDTLQYSTKIRANKSSTVISYKNSEIVTLYNYIPKSIQDIDIRDSFSESRDSNYCPQSLLNFFSKPEIVIPMNDVSKIYESSEDCTRFVLNNKQDFDEDEKMTIKDFNCKSKHHVLDFSKVEEIKTIKDLILDKSHPSGVMVQQRAELQNLIFLKGSSMNDLSGNCFLFGEHTSNINHVEEL